MRVQSIINGIKAAFSLFAEAISPVQSDIKKIINGMARVHAANLELVEKCDPTLGVFLNFLARDIEKNPQHLQPISSDLATRIQSLVCDVEIDLDSPLLEEK
jgi:hypothetical protein